MFSTRTMDVPKAPGYVSVAPAAFAPAMRPWRFAGPASAMRARAPGECVHGFRGVANGVDIGIGRLHAAVGFHAAGHADFESGGFGEFHFRFHADAQENQIRRQPAAIGEFNALVGERGRVRVRP